MYKSYSICYIFHSIFKIYRTSPDIESTIIVLGKRYLHICTSDRVICADMTHSLLMAICIDTKIIKTYFQQSHPSSAEVISQHEWGILGMSIGILQNMPHYE